MGDNSQSNLIAGPGALPGCAQVALIVHQLSTVLGVAHFVHTPSPVRATGLSTVVELLADGSHLTLEANVFAHQLGDLLDRMQRGGVVAPTEGAPDHR